MKKLFLMICALTITSTNAFASTSGGLIAVSAISYNNTGITFLYVAITPGTDAPVTGIPACVNLHNVGNTYDYAFDSTTAAGKSLLAGLISAQTSGLSVWIFGTGDCGVATGHESLQGFFVENP